MSKHMACVARPNHSGERMPVVSEEQIRKEAGQWRKGTRARLSGYCVSRMGVSMAGILQLDFRVVFLSDI